jgi:ubiquinol-cytochrome c reductase cytochrome b subunit
VTYPLFGIDAKFWGVVAMGAGTLILAFLPWLDRSPVKSIRYRGPADQGPADGVDHRLLPPRLPRHQGSVLRLLRRHSRAPVAQVLSVYYFLFFLTMPIWWSRIDKLPAGT